MKDIVVIEKWPDAKSYYRVYFHGKQIGNIDGISQIWYPFRLDFDRLLDCDKEFVGEHIDEFICVLQITNRMTS